VALLQSDRRYVQYIAPACPPLRVLTSGPNSEPNNAAIDFILKNTTNIRSAPYQGVHTNARIVNYFRASFRKIEGVVNMVLAESDPRRRELFSNILDYLLQAYDLACTYLRRIHTCIG